MEGNYGVYFGDRLCGKVQVLRQGLYYRFVCRCHLTGEVICSLRAVFPDREESLGVLVPMDDGFGLSTRIPAKRFDGKLIRFRAAARQEIIKEFFSPIYPEEPFGYLELLKKAYLVKKDGQIGMTVK